MIFSTAQCLDDRQGYDGIMVTLWWNFCGSVGHDDQVRDVMAIEGAV